MEDLPGRLTEACLEALERGRSTNHSDRFPARAAAVALAAVAHDSPQLAAGQEVCPEGDLRDRLAHLLTEQQAPAPKRWALDLMDHFQVFVPDGTGWRVSRRSDLRNPAMYSGSEILATADSRQLLRRLAHNYFFRFPEVLPLVAGFRTPGTLQANFRNRYVDAFVTVRRLNGPNLEFVLTELDELDVIHETDRGTWCLRAPPSAPVIAFTFLSSYLRFGEFRLPPPQCSRDDVENDVQRTCGPVQLDGPWQAELRPGGPPLHRAENYGADLRVLPDDCVWLVRCGLAEPAWIARWLRGAGAQAELARLRDWHSQVLDDFANPPRNRDEYLALFDPE